MFTGGGVQSMILRPPMGFWFWDYLKSKVYASNPRDLSQLEDAVKREVTLIPPAMLHLKLSTILYNVLSCAKVGILKTWNSSVFPLPPSCVV